MKKGTHPCVPCPLTINLNTNMKDSPPKYRRRSESVKLTEEDRIEAAALELDEDLVRRLVALIFVQDRIAVPPS